MKSVEKKKILILVKTYPNISSKYNELVCTAGITEKGEWIRLYPVPFRYQPRFKQYQKYQWIEVEIDKQKDDPRKESYRPNLDTLDIIGDQLSTKDEWLERKKMILPLLDKSIEELQSSIQSKKESGRSIGVIKPKEVKGFVIKPAAREWTPKQRSILRQQTLFGEKIKDLDKIPYKFSYTFSCDDRACKGHTLMIEDWEIGELYRKCLQAHKDERIAIQKVKEKYEGFLTKSDVYLVVGTTRKDHFRKTFVIVSVFPPTKPKSSNNLSLFGLL